MLYKKNFWLARRYELDGFTLIELLVCIAIIGVLSSIALPGYLNQSAKARGSEAKSFLGTVNRGQQGYYLANGAMASSLNQLDVKVSNRFYTYQIQSPNHYTAITSARALSGDTTLKNYDAAVTVNTTTDFFGQVICESKGVNQDPGGATAPTQPAMRGSCDPSLAVVLD